MGMVKRAEMQRRGLFTDDEDDNLFDRIIHEDLLTDDMVSNENV